MSAAASRRPPPASARQVPRFTGAGNPVGGPTSLALAVMDERGEPGGLLDGKVNAVNGAPGLDRDCGRELGGLGGLASLRAWRRSATSSRG